MSLLFVAGTHTLAVLWSFGTVHVDVVNADTGAVQRTLSLSPPGRPTAFASTPTGLSISRDGRALVSRDLSDVLVWDVSSLH